MTLEIKSERRNLTFGPGPGKPAVPYEKAVEIVKECVHLAEIEVIKDTIDSVYGCDCAYYGVDGFAIAEALYEAGYRKQIEGEWTRIEVRGKNYAQVYYQHNGCEVNQTQMFPSPYNSCPNCGAKMKRGESDDRN